MGDRPRNSVHFRLSNLFIFINFTIFRVFGKQNVLMIVVDDLRPSLGCYGDPNAVTPNIDLLAKRGVLFTRAFAQQALCAPSRNSFLTGRRPDTLKLYDFYSYWRDTIGNFSTLPQHLKSHGYTTMSIGKVFHPGSSSNGSDDFPYSWSEKPFHPYTDRYKDARLCQTTSNSTPACNIVCPVYVPHMPNQTLPDIETLRAAKSFLFKHRGDKKPFFLAVGFQKPHIPLKYPQKCLEHHPLEKFDVPDNYKWSENVSYAAYNPWLDLRKRDDVKKLDLKFPFQKIPRYYAKLIIQSYYAAVTYVDDLIGLLLKQLAVYNIERFTTVVLISDHGWSLGEHGEWAKYSNFEVALRVPVIITIPQVTFDPWIESSYATKNFTLPQNSDCSPKMGCIENRYRKKGYVMSDAMIELVDIFPTIADLTNLPIPLCIDDKDYRHKYKSNSTSMSSNLCSEGVSFLPVIYAIMYEKIIPWKKAVFSQYPRPGVVPTRNPNSDEPRLSEITIMGYTIRTKEYRYTAWASFNSSIVKTDWSTIIAEELYYHKFDVEENLNLSTIPEFSRIKNKLRNQLKNGWRKALPQRYKN
ncbi:iduronate 2-sulfatase isoform X1 [Neodiprion fabricii]|uniref:iduronate 2-sulfatase isoform X1 n=1 Tax=Neodiprion fabricii TaxID=2872261 RepID=UPI001ED91A11|nr:iduronate 2-sulfatase isoform X1 [Neodiprion fabricii]